MISAGRLQLGVSRGSSETALDGSQSFGFIPADGETDVSASRSILPLIDDETRHYFGIRAQADSTDQVGWLDGGNARLGRSYIGEPDKIAAELAQDAAVQDADTVLITVPNQLGVDFNARILASIPTDVRPSLD